MKHRCIQTIINILILLTALLLVTPQTVIAQEIRDIHSCNIVVLGDSNTWLGGDNCDKPEGWTKWFKETVRPASCRSYARSGSTWTNTVNTKRNLKENIGVLGDDNVIYNQINRLSHDLDSNRIATPDVIIIAAGTNDVWFKNKRPGVLDRSALTAEEAASLVGTQPCSVLTLAESVAQGCGLLHRICPAARIMLLTPMQTTQASETDVAAAGDIMENFANAMGLDIVRLDRLSCVKRSIEQRHYTYTTDGTHTNKAGAKSNGRLVAGVVLKWK